MLDVSKADRSCDWCVKEFNKFNSPHIVNFSGRYYLLCSGCCDKAFMQYLESGSKGYFRVIVASGLLRDSSPSITSPY